MSDSSDDCTRSATSVVVGQMSRRKTGSPSASVPRGSLNKVDVHRPGEGVGHDQRR